MVKWNAADHDLPLYEVQVYRGAQNKAEKVEMRVDDTLGCRLWPTRREEAPGRPDRLGLPVP